MVQTFRTEMPKAALSSVSYDRYILDLLDEDGNIERFHVDEVTTLQEFKKMKEMIILSDKFAVEDGLLVLPGETDPLVKHRYPSEPSKKIVRTMLKALKTNEDKGVCFSDFDESNILLTPTGKVKFKGVRIIRNLVGDELIRRIHCNYLSACTIIADLYPGDDKPEDIQHLLDLIDNDYGARAIFHIHAALVPITLYPALFKEMFDFVMNVLNEGDLRTVLSGLPYVDTWKALIADNELLQYTFTFNKNNSYEVPPDNPLQTCLNDKQKKVLKVLGQAPVEKQKALTPDQIALTRSLRFFEYLRNRTCHRLEPWKDWVLAKLNQKFNAQGSELVTYVRFPVLLPYVQLALHKMNKLRELPTKEFF